MVGFAKSAPQGRAALLRGPERLDFGEDPLAELVAGTSQREGGVRVQALQPAGTGLAADPAWQLGTQPALLLVAALRAGAQLRILPREPAPAIDTAGRLEPGNCRNELWAGQVVGGRERLARIVERLLLGDGGAAPGTADDYPPERSRRAAKLSLDDRTVIHPGRS